jgi:hypothetical protein
MARLIHLTPLHSDCFKNDFITALPSAAGSFMGFLYCWVSKQFLCTLLISPECATCHADYYYYYYYYYTADVTLVKEGNVHPITYREGTEGEYRYSCTLSLTLALDGGGWSTSRLGRFTPD